MVTALENTRTIAIISPLLKILEGVLLDQIKDLWNTSISIDQIGFRSHKGCSPGTTRIIKWIKEGKKSTAIVFIDLRKAFDNVIWDLIEEDLQHAKVKTEITCWIMHIVKRTTLQFNEMKAQRLKGLPQGSLISPILFNLYINRLIVKLKDFCDIIVYADDIAMRCYISNLTSIWKILYEGKNEGLIVNPEKSNYLIVNRCYIPVLEKVGIKGTLTYKHLGVAINSKALKTGRCYAQLLTKKIESLHTKSKGMPIFVKRLVMSAWCLSHASMVMPSLIASKGIKIEEVNRIWASAHRKIYGLPKWVKRNWVLDWLCSDKKWKERTYIALTKLDQIDEALELFIQLDMEFENKEKDTIRQHKEKAIKVLATYHGVNALGLYFLTNQTYTWNRYDGIPKPIVCSCRVTWTAEHANNHGCSIMSEPQAWKCIEQIGSPKKNLLLIEAVKSQANKLSALYWSMAGKGNEAYPKDVSIVFQ